MADKAPIAETKKIINPRVEIDTSPPFESVKEAVDRFGGSGPWIPYYLLRLATAHHDTDVFDVEKIEEQALQLERDLIMKEQETLNVLKELEAAKRFVKVLKINLKSELSSFIASPDLKLESTDGFSLSPISPGLMFMELNQAKSNLSKTSIDLAEIQASIELLNKKMRKDKFFLERGTKLKLPNSQGVSTLEDNHRKVEMSNGSLILGKEMNLEAEQLKKITEASKYEVMKAMTEIERTKNSIKMAEMRLNAAKKMEEAAKAVEAIALLNSENSADFFKLNGITLSLEEYSALIQKVQQAEDLCKTKFIDTNAINQKNEVELPILEKFEETSNENKKSREMDFSTKFKFKNSHRGHGIPHVLNGNESNGVKEKPSNGTWSKTSIGDVLSRKVILQDDVVVERHLENHMEKERVSLSQMLREQSKVIFHRNESTTDGSVEKRYFMRKKFGFIQVPIPTKQSKKKAESVNLR